MISLIVIYTYIIFLFFGAGVLLCILLTRIQWVKMDLKGVAPDFYLLLGLVVITTVLGFYSIFFPVNWVTNLIFFGVIYVLVIFNRRSFVAIVLNYFERLKEGQQPLMISILSFFPLLVIIALFSVSAIQSFDAGLYHAQFIQWMENFRTPPGLAWIHSRFAFNSHFHLLSALFSFSSLGFKSSSFVPLVFYPLNGFIFLMMAVRNSVGITKGLLSGDQFKAVLYAALLFCSFCIFGAKIQSPNPDIAVAILTYYAFIFFIEKFRFSDVWDGHQILLVLLILILPTFKLSDGLIVLLLIPICWSKSFKTLIPVGIAGLIVVLPFFIRNTIISGYPIYALPQIDFFNVDWKLPAENVLTDNAVIKAWARVPYKNYKEVLAMPFSEWFPVWWKTFGFGLDKQVLRMNLISPILMMVVFWIKRKTMAVEMIVMYLVLLINLIFCFISAPDPRFAWGFIYFNFAFTLASIIALFRFKKLGYVVGVAIFCFLYKSFQYTNDDWPQLLTKAAIKRVYYYPVQMESGAVEIFPEGTFPIWVPVSDDARCFNAPIPCTPYPLRRIRMRGESLADGFVYDEKIP